MSVIQKLPRIYRATVSLAGLAIVLWSAPVRADGNNQIRSLIYETAGTEESVAKSSAIPGTTTLRIRGSATPTFTVYKLDRPSRVVVDIANAALDTALTGDHESKATWTVNSWSVGQVSAHPLEGSGRSVIRVMVGLARPATYKVTAQGTDVVVTVTPRDPAPPDANSEAAARALAMAKERAARAEAAAQQAKAEAEHARKRAEAEAQRAAEAERARQAAESSRVEADKARSDADRAKAEAERANVTATSARAELERLRSSARASSDELEQARRAAEQAKTEAERARQAAAQAQSEAERARQTAVSRDREAERIKKEAIQAHAQADEARRQAAASLTEAERIKKEAAERGAAAERALASAAASLAEANRIKREAEQAKADADRARAEAEAETAQMKRDAAQARAAAEAARREVQVETERMKRAEKARAEAEAARSEALAEAEAQRKRAAAEAERAEKAIAEARAEAARAAKAVTEARAEAEQAKSRAEERVRAAETRMSEAALLMKNAETRLADARESERRALAAKQSADSAAQDAAERERQAAKATSEAKDRLLAAQRAEAAASRYRQEAQQAQNSPSTAGDDAKVARLRERAERAAADAEKRRAEAEAAARTADKSRADAEAAAQAAEDRRKSALAALEQAQQARTEAEAQRAQAEARRAQAEELRKQAETRRAEAEAAAAEATSRAERARELREREEAAYAKITKARAQAVQHDDAAQAAGVRLAAAQSALREAESRAEAMRKAAADAEARAAASARQSSTEQREVKRARQEAERLAADKRQAEADLRARQAALAEQEKQVAQLERSRSEAKAELTRLQDAANKARTARQDEEQKLAELTRRRAEAERKLEQAERARAQAEAEAARATQRATQAQQVSNQTPSASPAQAAAIPASTPGETKAARSATAQVTKVDFVDGKDLARVVLELSGTVQPKVLASSGRKAILEITGAELPAKLERTLDTSRFRGPIQAISSYRDPRQRDRVRVVVELDQPLTGQLKRSGTTYYWDFAKPASTRTGSQMADQMAGKKPSKASQDTQLASARSDSAVRTQNFKSPVVGGYGTSSAPITQKTVAQLANRKQKVYRGTKIDLDFKDADIHNLLRLLADVGGVNIVIPDEIQARVTVRLRRVPWDQALEVILASKGLWYRREGNLYRVAPRKQLDAEDQAEAERLANLAKSEAPEPQVFTLNYAVAKDVKAQVEPLLSPKGRVEVDERTNSLIINDIRAHRRRIVELLTRLDTQTPQIQIEARIVEARSTFVREFGVQWGGSALASVAGGNATGLIFPSSIGVRGGAMDGQTQSTGISAADPDFAVNLPAAVGSGSGGALGLSLGSVGGNFNINLRLSALEDSGSVRIISAPRITVLNNVEAEISQGVSIPISVISANGVQTQFVPADLSLRVVPHVSQRDCSIQMDLQVSKNEADFVNTGARGDPTILRKEAKTTILIADGETTVLGGIYTRNTGLSYSKVPFLGDLPVFGWFFKNRRENDERTEVLVFITPKITNKAFLRCE